MAMTPNVNFRISSVVDPTVGAQKALTSVGQLMQQRQENADLEKARQDKLLQQDIQNKRADAGLLLQQQAGERAQGNIDREVEGNRALNEYSNVLGNLAQNVVPAEQGLAINDVYEKALLGGATPEQAAATAQSLVSATEQAYNQDPRAQIATLGSTNVPQGDYDSSKLLALKEASLKRPQGLLDTVEAQKVAEATRQQKLKDQMYLANYKQSIKPKAGTGSKTSKLLYNKDGDAIEWQQGMTIPKGYMESSMYNKLYGDKSSTGSGILTKDGSVDQSKLITQNPKHMKEIDDQVSSMFTPESFDKDTSGTVGNQLANIQLLTGKTADGVLADFSYLKEGGMGRTGIDNDKIDSYYKDQKILLKTPEGVSNIPMSTALKNLQSTDKDGDPYYLFNNVNGKVQLTFNPDYDENAAEAEAKRKRHGQR